MNLNHKKIKKFALVFFSFLATPLVATAISCQDPKGNNQKNITRFSSENQLQVRSIKLAIDEINKKNSLLETKLNSVIQILNTYSDPSTSTFNQFIRNYCEAIEADVNLSIQIYTFRVDFSKAFKDTKTLTYQTPKIFYSHNGENFEIPEMTIRYIVPEIKVDEELVETEDTFQLEVKKLFKEYNEKLDVLEKNKISWVKETVAKLITKGDIKDDRDIEKIEKFIKEGVIGSHRKFTTDYLINQAINTKNFDEFISRFTELFSQM